MLALAPGVGYVHEPFSPKTPNGLSPAGFRRYYTVVTTENEDRFRPGLAESLALRYDLGAQLRSARSWRDVARVPRDYRRLRGWRRNGRRPLVKDPIALLSAEWLAATFDMASRIASPSSRVSEPRFWPMIRFAGNSRLV